MASPVNAETFSSFGELLMYLRKRAGLTQGELARAVGYSREQITRLEKARRAPDPAIIAARFVPALALKDEPALAARLVALAVGDQDVAGAGVPTQTRHTKPLAHNIPIPLLGLVGRERELAALDARLRDANVRLLTLVGAPGVGKTRLAIQLALDAQSFFADGVVFVSLALVNDAARVPETVWQALGLGALPTQGNLAALLLAELRERRALLVLDNLEHLPAAASFCAELLAHAPHLKLLVTSQTPLELYGEHRFTLEPLALPRARDALDAQMQSPAVALFVTRASQVRNDFALDADNARAVIEICARLDGLPLALELAAAQSDQLSPRALLAALGATNTLKYPAPNLPARHHTLSNAIGWSFRLLQADEQRLFTWLGVFRGGFTDEMVAALDCVPEARATLRALATRNLVHVEWNVHGELRYSLLETLRAFALEQLAARGEHGRAHAAHARFFLEFAERAEPHLTTLAQAEWLKRLEGEHDNFRAALEFTLDAHAPMPDAALALRLCNALWKFWRYRCYLAEGYAWTVRALNAAADARPIELRARAEWGAGLLAAVMQREDAATAHLEASLCLWEIAEDDRGVAGALTALGARKMDQGKFTEALRLQMQALKLYAQLNDAAALAYAHNALGETLRAAGDYAASRAEYAASLEHARAAGHERSVAVALANLAAVERALGNLSAAQANLLQALPVFVALNDRVNIASGVAGLACIEVKLQNPARLPYAAQLFGLAARLLQEAQGKFEAADEMEIGECIAQCRDTLGAETFAHAWQAGHARLAADADNMQVPTLHELYEVLDKLRVGE